MMLVEDADPARVKAVEDADALRRVLSVRIVCVTDIDAVQFPVTASCNYLTELSI
jgi:hypothetical protein